LQGLRTSKPRKVSFCKAGRSALECPASEERKSHHTRQWTHMRTWAEINKDTTEGHARRIPSLELSNAGRGWGEGIVQQEQSFSFAR
jgi:hypothetical protein